MRRNRWTAALCLSLLIFGGHRLQAHEPERQQGGELKAKMAAEGWTEIAKGVFERQRGATKVEHLGFGRAGLAWHTGQLTRQLEAMMLEYESYPSEDLAKAIDNLSVLIVRSKTRLRNMPEGLSSATAALSSCNGVGYGATADAYHRTDIQGVAAIADAWLTNSCGHSGDTYAYAYARATRNGTTTTLEQEDPHTGTPVTSHAEASVAGASASGVPCYSTANAYVQSFALGISYSASDTNNLCPIPSTPLSVTINGSDFESFNAIECRNVTWTSTVSSGTSPYTYQWKYNGTNVGTGSSYTRSVCSTDQDFALTLSVTDSTAKTAFDDHEVVVFREF